MNEIKSQQDRLSKNLNKLIDLINKQQNEIEKWKEKYDQLKEKQLKSTDVSRFIGLA